MKKPNQKTKLNERDHEQDTWDLWSRLNENEHAGRGSRLSPLETRIVLQALRTAYIQGGLEWLNQDD